MEKFPRVVRIEPAGTCNLKCIHCLTGTVKMKRYIMKPEIFAQILKSINHNRAFIKVVVLYHGGEPLLNSNFINFVKEIKSIDSKIFIKTVSNGMLLSPQMSSDLISSEIDEIEFSLDGDSAEESQYIRKKSNSKKIINNILQLVNLIKLSNQKKPDVYIANTKFVKDVSKVTTASSMSIPSWLKMTFPEGVKFRTNYAIEWPDMEVCNDFNKVELVSNNEDSNYCDHVINTITIRSDGNVVPCCYDLTSKLVMGNIMNNSLNEIWNNQKYYDLRKSIEEKNFQSICANCVVVKSPKYLVPKRSFRVEDNHKNI
jgi:radical SAM protein with 4Fe4S-binding SPASM domain